MALERAQGRADMRRESVFPALQCHLLHSTGRSAEPRAITLPFLLSLAFILAAPQRSLTIVITMNQYALSTDLHHPSFAALGFLNTDLNSF